jgi:hypothetical protein
VSLFFIVAECRYTDCHHAECYAEYHVIIVMLNVIMLNFIMLNVIMVIVVAPFIKLSSVIGIGLNGRVFGVETRKGSKHFVSLFR